MSSIAVQIAASRTVLEGLRKIKSDFLLDHDVDGVYEGLLFVHADMDSLLRALPPFGSGHERIRDLVHRMHRMVGQCLAERNRTHTNISFMEAHALVDDLLDTADNVHHLLLASKLGI